MALAESEFGRISNVISPPPIPIDMDSVDPSSPAFKTFTGPAPAAETSWETPWRKAQIGAANGHGNARSVAGIQAIVANGGKVGDVSLLSPETIELIFDEQSYGTDLVLGLPSASAWVMRCHPRQHHTCRKATSVTGADGVGHRSSSTPTAT